MIGSPRPASGCRGNDCALALRVHRRASCGGVEGSDLLGKPPDTDKKRSKIAQHTPAIARERALTPRWAQGYPSGRPSSPVSLQTILASIYQNTPLPAPLPESVPRGRGPAIISSMAICGNHIVTAPKPGHPLAASLTPFSPGIVVHCPHRRRRFSPPHGVDASPREKKSVVPAAGGGGRYVPSALPTRMPGPNENRAILDARAGNVCPGRRCIPTERAGPRWHQ